MSPQLSLDELGSLVGDGRIDTVVLALTDMQGRLQGKRFHARFFLEDVVAHGAEACNYLLAVDVDMNTVGGYAMAGWERGYGDFELHPDLGTLRLLPWQPGTALCLADLSWQGGSPVVASPRQVLRRQIEALAQHGWTAVAGTELEFIVFDNTYEEAWSSAYRDLAPANQYNVDYSILGTSRIEPLLRRLRNEMAGAGLVVESAKGECNYGQHEIAFRYADVLTTADNHSVYKTGAKEIAAQEHMALTFMAKFNEREGNSCHIHLSLRDADGRPVFADEHGRAGAGRGVLPGGQGGEAVSGAPGGSGWSDTFRHFLAGQLACLRELTLLLAPNVNSYKRYVKGSFAPTAVAWGNDNRTCALRVVGHGTGLRFENRVPGGDVNPYLALAALIAAGLYGVERELPLEAEVSGNAYEDDRSRVPSNLRDAAGLFERSAIARAAFSDEVVDHYVNMARVELASFDAAVTDWELYRSFERL